MTKPWEEFKILDNGTPPWMEYVNNAQFLPDPVSALDAINIGAGRTFDKVIAGVQQLALPADAMPGDPRIENSLSQLEAEQNANDKAFSNLEREHPVAANLGQAVPYVAIPPTLSPLTQAGIVASVEGLKYGTPQERAVNAGTGFVGSLVGSKAANALGGAIKSGSNVDQFSSEVLDNAGKLGVKPRMSQLTNSPKWKWVEDVSARNVGGRGVWENFNAKNQEAIDTALAASIGENATDLSAKTLANAKKNLGAVFDDIKNLGSVNVGGRSVKPILIDKNVGNVASGILSKQAKRATPNDQLISLAKQAQVMASNNGRIDGEAYQLLRSDISNLVFDADGVDKVMYGELLNAIDDAADKSLRMAGKTKLADQLREVRPKYKNYKMLTRGTVAEAGHASPAKVAGVLRQQEPDAFRTATNPNTMQAIGQYGEHFKPLSAGSPTAERNPLWQATMMLPSWLGAKASTSWLPWYPKYIGSGVPAKYVGDTVQTLGRPVGYGLLDPLLNSFIPQSAK